MSQHQPQRSPVAIGGLMAALAAVCGFMSQLLPVFLWLSGAAAAGIGSDLAVPADGAGLWRLFGAACGDIHGTARRREPFFCARCFWDWSSDFS